MTSARFQALGCLAVVAVTAGSALPRALLEVGLETAAVEDACSRFRPASALSRLNERPGEQVAVPPLLLAALREALRAAELTDGLVDPTLGQHLRAAGYDRDFRELAAAPGGGGPAPRVVVARPARWRDLVVDVSGGTVTVPRGVSVDLGATAKAWAADRSAQRAAAACPGVGVLVGLGGDIAVAGPAPEGGWLIRLEDSSLGDPRAGTGPVVAVRDGGLATSGTAVRRWAGGRHHLIDPISGLPARTQWRTVSVAAGSALDANIASTAAMLLGQRAPGWLEAAALPGRLVGNDGSVRTCAGWPADPVPAAA